MAHATRHFFEFHANHKSQIAAQALHHIAQLYEVEREVQHRAADERRHVCQARSRPLAGTQHQWLVLQRNHILDATATALDYSLKRWGALTRFLDDAQVLIDNNWLENQIRPWAVGRANWLFAGLLWAAASAPLPS